jgi:hypothetical protein
MPTISDLFKNQKKELYGTSDMIRIDSRGLVNPTRAAALLLSSANSLGDEIGNQIAGAVGGSANRPDDTIFKDNSAKITNKPISLFKTQADLKTAVKAGEPYFVKQSPAKFDSLIGTIKSGASSPLGAVAGVGIGLLQGLKNKNPTKGNPYGQKYQMDISGKTLEETKTFSGFYETYENKELTGTSKGPKSWVVNRIEQRGQTALNEKWDDANELVNSIDSITNEQLAYVTRNNGFANQVWVLFKKLGNNQVIPFAGTISGLSEDVSPEWTNFRYLGSPFKTYRYQGVERSLKFELKLYYVDSLEKDSMIKKINYLKSLAFPYEQISEIKHNNKDSKSETKNEPYNQYAFSPNLVTLQIGDMYKNMFGFIESLSFSIDDNTAWPNNNPSMNKDGDNTLYPSVVSVSISFKIIETPMVDRGTVTKYRYNFDGLEDTNNVTKYGMYNILETQTTKQVKAADLPNISTKNETNNTLDKNINTNSTNTIIGNNKNSTKNKIPKAKMSSWEASIIKNGLQNSKQNSNAWWGSEYSRNH